METGMLALEFVEGAWHRGGSIPLSDRGFRYGMHFFETIAVRRGMPMFWEAHLAILLRCAEAARFVAPPGALDALKSCPPGTPGFFGSGEGIARLHWTAGPGTPSDPPRQGRILLTFEEQTLPSSPVPLQCGIATKTHSVPGDGWKTGNYWGNVAMYSGGRECGYDEMLVFDGQGHWLGGCLSNGFVRLRGRWVTPPAGKEVRAGTARAHLLGLLDAREQTVSREALLREGEALLLTNSRLLVAPVVRLGGCQFEEPPEAKLFYDFPCIAK